MKENLMIKHAITNSNCFEWVQFGEHVPSQKSSNDSTSLYIPVSLCYVLAITWSIGWIGLISVSWFENNYQHSWT
jgi:hypothetical protein